MKKYWLFGGQERDQVIPLDEVEFLPDDVRGEEIATLSGEDAEWVSSVPPEFRWEAAQMVMGNWSPSRKFSAWLYGREC